MAGMSMGAFDRDDEHAGERADEVRRRLALLPLAYPTLAVAVGEQNCRPFFLGRTRHIKRDIFPERAVDDCADPRIEQPRAEFDRKAALRQRRAARLTPVEAA